MTGRDDFENRLGQGLKRWAQAGEPSLDLEALVREREGQPATDALALVRERETAADEQAQAETRVRPRRWTRWLGGVAAAAAIVLGMSITFPSWAGAAANWPLIGPVVTQIILEDAGMKWAYDMGLIDGNVAEVTQNGITVRILGVLADSRRTTVLYQVQGAPPTEPRDGPAPWRDSWIVPPDDRHEPPVSGFISKVNGQGASSSSSGAEETPLGYIGTTSTIPLETEQAELELTFEVGSEKITLPVPASREQTDKFSREVAVNQTLEHDGVRVTVEAVIYTPAETVVRFREEKEHFMGSYSWDSEVEYDYLEVDGQQYKVSGGSVMGVNNVYHVAFPPVEGPARLVLKPVMKGRPIDTVWPLQEGAVGEVMGVPITLVAFERTADGIGFRWEGPDSEQFRGVGSFEVIDSEGNAHPLGHTWSSTSNYVNEGVRYQHYSAELSLEVEPVAVRATQAAVIVEGPWVFELPR